MTLYSCQRRLMKMLRNNDYPRVVFENSQSFMWNFWISITIILCRVLFATEFTRIIFLLSHLKHPVCLYGDVSYCCDIHCFRPLVLLQTDKSDEAVHEGILWCYTHCVMLYLNVLCVVRIPPMCFKSVPQHASIVQTQNGIRTEVTCPSCSCFSIKL